MEDQCVCSDPASWMGASSHLLLVLFLSWLISFQLKRIFRPYNDEGKQQPLL